MRRIALLRSAKLKDVKERQTACDAMRARLPRTPSDLLDHASRVLFHTVDRDLDDPCEAIARAGRSVTAREHAAFDLAWAVFVLAADRTVPVTAWPKWKPPMRDGPGTDI